MKSSVLCVAIILVLICPGRGYSQRYVGPQRYIPVEKTSGTDHGRQVTVPAPLLDTRWGQGCLYNASCPVDTSAHTTCLHAPAGSGAVAMAQIMKFYRYPAHGTGEHGYPHPQYGIQYANFGAANYDWDACPDSLTSGSEEVATLLYHCGVAQDMNFGALNSTSSEINLDSGLVRYFGYPKTATWRSKADYTDAQWTAMLKAELDASHPLICSGYNSTGTLQHYFICDGYQGDTLFHFNWGMGGLHNGYFPLTELKPDTVDYSFEQRALFNLAPSVPGPNNYVMDFENVPDFSLSFNDWTAVDLDLHDTYGITNVSFPHQTEPMAFISFNPAQVTPSMAGDQAIQPHAGQRFGACFSSNPPSNSDWLISPRVQLGTNGSFSFWIKSYNDVYGLDKYKVAVSVTDKDPASFTVISGAQPLQTTTSWTKKTFNLTGYNNQLVYVAVQCVSNDNFLMMVDDLEVQPQASSTLHADFTADKTSVRIGEAVSFTDQSSGLPVSWEWKFPGGSPAASGQQNPAGISYAAPGSYAVSLKVSNGQTTDSVTKQAFITVTGYPVAMSLDFESVPDFSLTFAPWTATDVRGGNTYGINQPSGLPYQFPHANEPMAYICFNPSKTVPPMTNLVPHGGQKLGCSFSSYPPMNPNDKWLITPKMSLGSNPKIEFWVQAFNSLYGEEKYNVAVSLTDAGPSSFVKVNGAVEIAPDVWTNRSYDLSYYSNQDVHIGIQCVTDNSFIFMIDDITVSSSLAAGPGNSLEGAAVFPNPARNFVNIHARSFRPLAVKVDIVSMFGETVASFDAFPAEGKVTLDVAGIPAGIYLLRISDGSETVARKVTIIK